LNCVFVDVGCYVSFADLGLCDAFLVATHRGDDADVLTFATMQTTNFFPSLPHVLLLSRLHK